MTAISQPEPSQTGTWRHAGRGGRWGGGR